MESISLDLLPHLELHRGRVLERTVILLLGLVNLAQAFTLHAAFRYVNLTAGILLILLAVFYRRLYKLSRVTIDDKSIEGSLGGPGSSRISWEDVLIVEWDIPFFRISTKDGNTASLDLSNITIRQQLLLIPRITEFVRAKGIAVRLERAIPQHVTKRKSSRKQKR